MWQKFSSAGMERRWRLARGPMERREVGLDRRMGLQPGAPTVVTDEGAESLHSVHFEPIVAAR